ncbi:MAG: hypothetical protein M1167_05565, partial [Chloroflexi bacterium]|nr:hypothetical protein [Chloroflexota bacterium]
MMLIVWSLASAYFFFTLSQNTIYVDAVRQKNQTELDRMSESVQALNTSYVVSSNGIVRISARLQNVGSFS